MQGQGDEDGNLKRTYEQAFDSTMFVLALNIRSLVSTGDLHQALKRPRVQTEPPPTQQGIPLDLNR